MKKIKFVIYIFMLLIGFSTLFANSIKASELSGIKQMEEILKEKKETGEVKLPGYVIGEDDGELSGDEESWKAHKAIYDRLLEREKIVSQYIEPNPNIEIVENETNTNVNSIVKNNTIYIVLFIFAIVLVYIVSMVFKNKKILFFEIAIIVAFIILMNNNLYNQSNNSEISDKEKNKIIKYLKGEIEDKKLDNFANEYKKNYFDKYNEKEVDLSKVINDYIIKCYYCVKRKANGQELYTEDLEVLNCFEEESHKYDFTYDRRYVDVLDWEKIDNWQVVNNILSKESMQGIYDSITDEDVENFNNGTFLDKLVKSINKNIKSKEDFDAYSIIPYDYFRIYRLDVTPLYQCKYWYLEKGEDLTLSLPYGATFKYEIAKLEKRDIEKIENVEMKKIEFDPENEKTMFIYYIDSNSKKQGVFTTVYSNKLYNKYEIIDNLKYASIDVYSNSKNNVLEKKESNNNRVAIAGLSFAIERTASKYRTDEIYTSNFLKKNKNEGIVPELDIREVIDRTKEYIKDDYLLEDKFLCELKHYGNKDNEYGIFKLKWKDNKVDDIEYYIVPEDKMNLSYEEMYQLAFND